MNGPIYFPIANTWSSLIEKDRVAENKTVIVLLCTRGGDPDEAFRMMSFLHDAYQTVNVYVFGECYSAGTLFSLGADRIFMSPNAQLGPLDVQIRRDDEAARISGECYRQALTNLSSIASSMFDEQFKRLKNAMGFPISTPTASRIATEITVGLLAPITSQIEPSRLGEVFRAQNIGVSYGVRLMRDRYGEADAFGILAKLACQYSSHSTVIDYREAVCLGLHVERFCPKEYKEGVFVANTDSLLTQAQPYQLSIITKEALKK